MTMPVTVPVTVTVPHRLGRAEARARVDRGIGQLSGWFPGGAEVEHHWQGDTLHFTLAALGQTVAAELLVEAEQVVATVQLPGYLGFLADRLRAKMAKEAPKLLA